MLCFSLVLIDQVGVYVSALKIGLLIQRSCSIHFLISMRGASSSLQSPDCSATALLYHSHCGWGEVAAVAGGGIGFPEFPFLQNSFLFQRLCFMGIQCDSNREWNLQSMWFEKLKFVKFIIIICQSKTFFKWIYAAHYTLSRDSCCSGWCVCCCGS